jgi:4-hydroxy-2-oxoheptanedioate aldolase
VSLGTDRLKGGVPSFGTFQTLPSTIVAEGLGRMGYDFVIVDLQHGTVTGDSLLEIIIGIEKGRAIPIVRVGWNDPMLIMRALDLGAAGVVIPMVSTPEEAARAVSATRYAPEGTRSIGPMRHHCVPAGHTFSPEQMNRDVLVFPMIETVEALENVDAIAGIPGVGGLFFGPFDMALSMGLGMAAYPPAVLGAVDRVVAACDRYGIIAGTVSVDIDGAEALYRRGMQLVALGSDLSQITAGARREVAEAERVKGSFKRRSAG